MANMIQLDFTNVKELTNLSAGKHVLKVKKYEQVTAQSGNPMIDITFENAQGEIGIDHFVMIESSLWKFKNLLTALFKQNFTGLFNFDLDTMIGRTCTAVAKEEEYVKQDGTPSIRTVLDNYMPINDADAMGMTPQAPGMPQPQAPVQPQVPPMMTQPQAPVAPVAPQAPVQPTPVQPQPQVVVQPTPVVNPQPVVNPAPVAQPQAVVQPQPVVQPQAVAPAQPTPAPAQTVAKRPWE